MTAHGFVYIEMRASREGLKTAVPFYREMFGWGMDTLLKGDRPYIAFDADDGVGGGFTCPEFQTPMWLPYVRVDEIEEAVRRAVELNATVVQPAFVIPLKGQLLWSGTLRRLLSGSGNHLVRRGRRGASLVTLSPRHSRPTLKSTYLKDSPSECRTHDALFRKEAETNTMTESLPPVLAKNPQTASAWLTLCPFLTSLESVTIREKSTCVHVDASGAAFLGAHPRKNGLRLTLVLDHPLENNCIAKSEAVSKSRYHNEVDLSATDSLDAELKGWIEEAYALRVRKCRS